MRVEVISEQQFAQRPPGWRRVLGHTHTYSGKDDHGGPVQPPESYEKLVEWTQRVGVDALGMGSPYTPKSAKNYGLYDDQRRDLYYRDDFDPRSVLDLDEIEQMLRQVNALSRGTLFYLDNETPKGRYGHMWWIGHHADYPAWHDYDQPFDRWMISRDAGDFGDEPMPYERRTYTEIIALQRASGGLGIWAHPTSWWLGDKGQFITNIASEMPAHLIADGYVDGMVVMGYHPYRPEYLGVWYELLDRGWRVPGVAEMDCGLSHPALWEMENPYLTHAHLGDAPLTVENLVAAFRAGRISASSGPFVEISVDDAEMGQAAATSPGRVHRVTITALPHEPSAPIARVELVGRGGQVLWSREHFPGGRIELGVPGSERRGYLLVQVFGDGGERGRGTKRFAVSNPVYLHPRGESFNKPATTEVELSISAASPFHGGEVRFESAAGELLSTGNAHDLLRETLPANGRITLHAADGRRRTDYLANANRQLQDVQRHLYRGRFLRDFPDLKPGELPPAAWRLDDYVDAMRRVTLDV